MRQSAPLPTGPIVLVDTDVESSTALWEWNPKVMSLALTMHDDVLRTQLKIHNGVEVMTEGALIIADNCVLYLFVGT